MDTAPAPLICIVCYSKRETGLMSSRQFHVCPGNQNFARPFINWIKLGRRGFRKLKSRHGKLNSPGLSVVILLYGKEKNPALSLETGTW